MFDPSRIVVYARKTAFAYLLILGLLISLSFTAVFLSYQFESRPWPRNLLTDLTLPVLLGMVPGLLAFLAVWRLAGRFVRSLYGLEKNGEGRNYLKTRLFGQPLGGPYIVVKEGKVTTGGKEIRKIGGPGAVVVYLDSAVVLERFGRLTTVKRGSGVQRLEPFERVWDVIDLRPQHWVFRVLAITQDGIPIAYHADISFQVGDTDDDILKAATCKWIREASRTEPDRLMTWPSRVIIADTEGALRSILARYTLNRLIDPDCREEVRAKLEESLRDSVPRLGVKIVRVALGDLELKDQVIQQWIQTWQTERACEVDRIIAKGKAEAARIAERARAEVRIGMLANTARVFAEMAERGQRISSDFVVLSFIEMIKRTSSARNIYLPDAIVKTLNLLQARCQGRTSDQEEPPEEES